MTNLVAFFIFETIGSITPGPNNMMLFASGVNHGFRKTLPHVAGVTCGFAFMQIVIALGFAQVMHRIPYFYEVLTYGGLIYIGYLAYKIALTPPLSERQKNTADETKPFGFWQAFAFLVAPCQQTFDTLPQQR